MSSIKSTLMAAGLILASQTCLAEHYIKIATKAIDDCYASKHHFDHAFTECISDTLRNIPNPQKFKIYLEGRINTEGAPFNLVFWNPLGLKMVCQISAKEKITITECQEHKLLPLTNDPELSIVPRT